MEQKTLLKNKKNQGNGGDYGNEGNHFIQPDRLFYHYRIKADNYEFNLTDLQAGFNELERQGEEFSGLFSDIDLNSTKLGSNAQ